jgi:hypothetical protein
MARYSYALAPAPAARLDTAFAAASRERCAPAECDRRNGCWVAEGTGQSLNPNRTGVPRCLACQGKVQWAFWQGPIQ